MYICCFEKGLFVVKLDFIIDVNLDLCTGLCRILHMSGTRCINLTVNNVYIVGLKKTETIALKVSFSMTYREDIKFLYCKF